MCTRSTDAHYFDKKLFKEATVLCFKLTLNNLFQAQFCLTPSFQLLKEFWQDYILPHALVYVIDFG